MTLNDALHWAVLASKADDRHRHDSISRDLHMLKRVLVDSLNIAYDEVGTGERPLVLVHGFSGSRDDFADVLEPISQLGRTLVPDLRGHGDTANPGEGYSLNRLRDDLAGFLDATGVKSCDLLGHSLGGMIALRLVLSEPDKVASLILMDTAARAHMRMPNSVLSMIKWITRIIPMRWQWHALKATRHRRPEPARRAEQEMGSERYWQRIRAKLEAMDKAAFNQLVRAFTKQRPLGDRLHEIHCPTLVLVGDQDEAFLEPSREMAEGIPDAKLIIIKNAHHSPQIEARDAWLDTIRAHLKRVRA